MQIELEKKEKELILYLTGRLDTTTAPELQKALDKELGDTSELIIDMKKLEYLSSAGLRVLLATTKKMTKKGGKMTICHANQNVRDVFEITGFKKLLNIR
ncbi:MAG: STAS domain-containing protein [Lachnospiraceae bacterium]